MFELVQIYAWYPPGQPFPKDSALEREEGSSLYLLGRIAIKNENYALAEKYLNEAEELARKMQSKSLLQYILISLADLTIHNQQFDECRQIHLNHLSRFSRPL